MGRSNAVARNAQSSGIESPSGGDLVVGGVATGVDTTMSVIEGTIAEANGAAGAASALAKAFAGVFGVLGVGISMGLAAKKEGATPSSIASAGFAAGAGALAGFGAGALVGGVFGSVPGAVLGGVFGLFVGALFSIPDKGIPSSATSHPSNSPTNNQNPTANVAPQPFIPTTPSQTILIPSSSLPDIAAPNLPASPSEAPSTSLAPSSAPSPDVGSTPTPSPAPTIGDGNPGPLPSQIGDGNGIGTLLQGADQVVNGQAPITMGDPNVENPVPPPSSPGNLPGATPDENGPPALTSENLPANIANANASMDLPAEVAPAGGSTAFQDAVQQAANVNDGVNQSVADNLQGNTFGNDTGNFGSGNFGSGDFGSGGFGSGGGSGGFSGGGSGGGSPIVLDVATQLHQPDHGIKITPLSSSNKFFDMTGSGRQNLTAWAGAGNGVLFFDPTGQGQLTQEKQIEFTAWDPGATSDMQALEDVFDTNHDGSLNAGDADFNDFFVMVTNPDGTETAYSLAQLGITSINLNANATNITLPDGSSINGETTYTTSTGTTGTAATVTFAFDPDGQIIQTTTTVNADGSTTVANAALNADGSVAYARILNTSANGLDSTLTTLNSGGVVVTLQTDNTVVNADGSTTETVTNYAGGTIQADGELTANDTAGSEKLNSTTTTTSANGLVVTILRDQLGGGWTTQKEVDTTNADGSASIVISNLNPDGSASSVTTTNVSADGLTRTETNLVDGIAADSTTSVDATVVNGTTRMRDSPIRVVSWLSL